LNLHAVNQDFRRICVDCGTNRYRVPSRFGSEQSRHFKNDRLDVDHLAFRGHAFFVEGPQTVNDIGRAVSFPLASSCGGARSFQVGGIMREPSQTRVGACDRGGYGLLDFVRQRGGQFAHHVDPVDMQQIGLQLAKPFALRLGTLLLGYIHCDPEVFTGFTRGIVVSYGTQEPDLAVVGTNNTKSTDIVIRSSADCILESCPHGRLVFRVSGGPKTFKWNMALAWIEAVQTKRFIRQVKYLSRVEIRGPTTDMGQALRLSQVCLFPAQFSCQ